MLVSGDGPKSSVRVSDRFLKVLRAAFRSKENETDPDKLDHKRHQIYIEWNCSN